MAAPVDGSVFVIRDDKDRVVKGVFDESEAKKATRKRGWAYEAVPNALTDRSVELLNTRERG